MLTLSRRAVLTGGALLGTVAIALPTLAAGSGTPANKAVAAGSKAEVIAPNTNKPILSATFKTSKPTDLLIGVSLECSILTDLVIPGSSEPGASQSATGQGSVRVWAELDGKIVPIEDVSAPPQDPADSGAGDESDKITFCDRVHTRTVSDAESDPDGIDKDRDYQATKGAHAFNWVRLNAGSGLHTLVIKADLTASGTNATAEAIIGNRTLVVEPTKLANDAVIAENGTS